MWSYLHGIGMLIIDQLVTIDITDPDAVEALGESLINIYLDGVRQSLPKKNLTF
jgi:hypothetical protein